MSYSQNVVSGGWIPVPQEMMDATGISEEDILATKQWGKVVPMMRKIGDYVLSTYLVDDPRKAMIMRWKARYCNGPNKKQKENMISPIVGFIYMIDSFKNHRGPDELGQERNHWRKRLLAQINCKTTWKRAHTALAKIIHNRMNMADSNPGKQQMWMMREIYRRPDVPWSVADYGNLGYPDDEDEGTSLIDPSGEATLEKIESEKPTIVNKKPKLLDVPPPPSSPTPPAPPPGTVALQTAITAQKAEGNYPDPAAGTSGDYSDDDDDEMFDATGPSHDSDSGDEVAVTSYPSSKPPGQPPSAAAFVMRPDDISSDDEMVDADPPPYSAPSPPPPDKPEINPEGYDPKKAKPESVIATAPDQPKPPPSTPSVNLQAAVQLDTDGDILDLPAPSSSAPFPPPDSAAIPVSSSSPSPPQDPDSIAVSASSSPPKPPSQGPNAIPEYPLPTKEDADGDINIAFLFENGVPPPPPPPTAESVLIEELEERIKRLEEKLASKGDEVAIMRSEKEAIESDRVELRRLAEERLKLLTQRDADIETYRKRLEEWGKRKDVMDEERSNLEKQLEEMRNNLAVEKAEYEEIKKNLEKQVDDLQSEKKALEAKWKQIDGEYASLSSKFEDMKKQNAELAGKISEAGQNSEEFKALQQQAIDLDKKLQDLQQKLRSSESEREHATRELESTQSQLTEAEKKVKQFARQKKKLQTTYEQELEKKGNEIRQSYAEQIDKLQKEIEEKKKSYQTLLGNKKAKEAEAESLHKEIDLLKDKIRLAEIRIEEERKSAHEEGVNDARKEMEEVVRNLNATIKRLTEENAKLKRENEELKQNLALLESQYTDLVNSSTAARGELQRIFSITKDAKVQELQGVITQMQQNAASQLKIWQDALNTANQERTTLSENLAALYTEYMQQNNALEQQWKTAKLSIEQQQQQLNQQLQAAASQREQIAAEKQQVETEKQRLEAQKRADEERIIRIREEAQSKTTEISLQAKLNEELLRKLHSSIERIGTALGFRGVVEDIDAALAGIEKQVSDLIKAYNDTVQKFNQANQTAQSEGTRALALQQSVDIHTAQVKSLSDAQVNFQAILSNAQKLTEDQKKEILALNERITELTKKNANEVQTLKELNEQLSREKQTYADEASNLSLSNEELKKKVADLEATFESLNAKLEEKTAYSDRLKEGLDKANDEIQRLTEQKNQLEEVKRGIDNSAKERLESTSQKYQQQIKELEAQVKRWQGERNDMAGDLEQLRMENLNLIAKVSSLTDELEQEKSFSEEQTEQILDLQQEMERLQDQLDIMQDARSVEGSSKRRRMSESESENESVGMKRGRITVDDGDERTQRTLVNLGTIATEQGAEAIVYTGSLIVRNPITEDQIYILVIRVRDKTGRPKDLLLWVKYDLKGNPVSGFFTDARGKKVIPEGEWRNNGIPFVNWVNLQQKLLADKIQPKGNMDPNTQFIREKINAEQTIKHDIQEANEYTKEVKDRIRSENNDIAENTTDFKKLNAFNNDNRFVLLDPAELFPIFEVFAKGISPRYANALGNILNRIKEYVQNEIAKRNLPESAFVNFVSDPNYVPKERIAGINDVIRGKPPRLAWEAVWTNLLGHVRNITADHMPAGFKKWMRVFYKRYGELLQGDRDKNIDPTMVIELDPKLIYHTIASLVHDMLHAGPESSLITGFGYPTGIVPIPTMRGNPDTSKLYDYYGYGFNPFLKKLHNPPSYYVSDYYRY